MLAFFVTFAAAAALVVRRKAVIASCRKLVFGWGSVSTGRTSTLPGIWVPTVDIAHKCLRTWTLSGTWFIDDTLECYCLCWVKLNLVELGRCFHSRCRNSTNGFRVASGCFYNLCFVTWYVDTDSDKRQQYRSVKPTVQFLRWFGFFCFPTGEPCFPFSVFRCTVADNSRNWTTRLSRTKNSITATSKISSKQTTQARLSANIMRLKLHSVVVLGLLAVGICYRPCVLMVGRQIARAPSWRWR